MTLNKPIVCINEFKGKCEEIQTLLANPHDNILGCHQAFKIREQFFLVTEPITISLCEIIACPDRLQEQQVATVAKEFQERVHLNPRSNFLKNCASCAALVPHVQKALAFVSVVPINRQS
ncbi:hypothetical protein C7212DRAFT_341590 [Tuber magnatum]|uniref:Protein kinase domain-containing protein n=1 Tax=Tuber magnatum TaxID=42249 RepID=A0A317SX10_9PEZI|nr:hypothetical protein C7212DRAFT_341590 [Tuber magnatum]